MTRRRTAVTFDSSYFEHRAARGDPLSPVEAFRLAFQTNLWGGGESPSGPGSSLDQTAGLRTELPALLRRHRIASLLDLPCGDGHWMAGIDLSGIKYLGGDLLAEVVERATVHNPQREFQQLDVTTSPLPYADMLLCRDCLVHLSFRDIEMALGNIRRSGIPFLLATTFPEEPFNQDITTGDWRPLNLSRAPFHLPPPLELLAEGCTEQSGLFADKSLGLWRVAELAGAQAWP